MEITIIGTGYVGLTTGACFAHIGHKVICVDNDERKIDLLNKGIIPIYEPKLDEIIEEAKRKNLISFTTDMAYGVKNSKVLFIAVGTPPKETGEPDLSYVENVASQIGEHMDSYRLIVEKSTVPVKTAQWIRTTIARFNKKNVDFDVAVNPEFLREGSAVDDFLNPDRIVIGVENKRAEEILLEIYKPIKAPILITDLTSAELIKHASNAFLAMKISFINAISIICEKTGADVEMVAKGVGLDKRIGPHFLKAGVGYGGFCFPKDLAAFIKIAEELGYDFRLLKEVANINEKQKEYFVKKMERVLWNLKDKIIGIWGLSFKPNTDDIRFAPALDIINLLKKEGAKIKAYDPKAMEKTKEIIKDITYCDNPYDVCKDADCVALITEWEEFANLDFEKIKSLMRQPIIFDGRNFLDKEKLINLGFHYYGIGKK
ncbi:MAG: UDP-glucose/GDP-mannose dehydrogenase family protein [candidate division WOR-3 bacterium]|nr:UDP-glucose/GDP-mannose dehydrogenase family protein [candidate division WOR-3 bacterium]MCX7836708.1 UDP-glucose/GDP-mannose dehydrogenase family protein [candidate division WOR-3 bacterium]MDW8113455.1 UDP-glucose/GDP-mannose dehydrogenase family protein [candidate division WOR-3 bacterium]